jgi:hypothetical protein
MYNRCWWKDFSTEGHQRSRTSRDQGCFEKRYEEVCQFLNGPCLRTLVKSESAPSSKLRRVARARRPGTALALMRSQPHCWLVSVRMPQRGSQTGRLSPLKRFLAAAGEGPPRLGLERKPAEQPLQLISGVKGWPSLAY